MDSRRARELRAIARAAGELLDVLDDDEITQHLDNDDCSSLARANSIVHEVARGVMFR